MLSLVFFVSWESACDQHKSNQHCSDRGQGFCILLEQNENSSYKLKHVLCWTLIEVISLL
ncbi:unnamed protein product [Staurois parvus]|uniref:Uncharacterized protein n=1 Tax=Staurois parvus TaxID=386267 RepID=A0ABN9DH91_9NEOB|nr:unnamed protein product [Staurois parvus]